jgi:hypothetical protein
MDASQLLYPKIVHSGSNGSFASCSCRWLVKSSETLTNIILCPMDLNGCFTTLVPRDSASGTKYEFCILYVPKVSEMLRNTPKHHFWVQWTRMDASQILVPRNTSFASFTRRRIEKCFETLPNIILGPMD